MDEVGQPCRGRCRGRRHRYRCRRELPGGPTPVVEAPAPNFECWQPSGPVTTERAIYLPTAIDSGGAKLGIVGQILCFSQSSSLGGGATFSQRSPGPVPYFFTSGYLPNQVAAGVVDDSITHVEFVPTDGAAPARDAAELIVLGEDRAFSIPHVSDGVVRFYRGSTVAAEETVSPAPEPVDIGQPVSTGQACDPTAVGALLNTSEINLTDGQGKPVFAAVYLEPLDPGHPAGDSSRALCLLVRSTAPAVSASAAPLGPDRTISYLAATPGNGGTYIWGRLTGDAATLSLIHAAGGVTTLRRDELDATRSNEVTFVTFIPDGAPPVTSVQAQDADGRNLGDPIPLN